MNMKIEYDYEILLVDEESRVMEVRYTSDQNEVLHVSIPLPKRAGQVDRLIEQYAPVNYWGEKRVPVVTEDVPVGAKGHSEGWYGPRPLTPEEEEALALGQKIQIAHEVAGRIAAMKVLDEVMESLSDKEIEVVTYFYPEWSGEGVVLKSGDKVRRKDVLYRVKQGHTTQPDWTPEDSASLFVPVRDPNEPPVWEQPQGSHDAFDTGERTRHLGSIWVSKIDANTTEPGSDPRWWEEEV